MCSDIRFFLETDTLGESGSWGGEERGGESYEPGMEALVYNPSTQEAQAIELKVSSRPA